MGSFLTPLINNSIVSVIRESSLSRMLIQESLLNPLIQNCKLVVIEEHSFVIVDISASNPLTQSILWILSY